MIHRLSLAACLVAASACTPTSGNLPDPTEHEDVSGQAVRYSADASTGPDVCAREPKTDRASQVCWRWTCDGRAATPATWNGDVDSCNAGTLDPAAAQRTLALVNLHRFLADMPAVGIEPAWSPAAQQCALVAHANAKLSHTPPRDWTCWNQTAYDASEVSLVANRSGPASISAFMEDPGNETSIVHRRWLLSDQLVRIGLGSTDHYACVVVDGKKLDSEIDAGTRDPGAPTGRKWAAWPPAGPVPMDVITSEQLDTVGWTVQSGEDDLDPTTAVIVSNGVTLKTTTTLLEAQLGSRSAVRILPVGWATAAGARYDVTVSGPTTHIAFTVEPTDCGL